MEQDRNLDNGLFKGETELDFQGYRDALKELDREYTNEQIEKLASFMLENNYLGIDEELIYDFELATVRQFPVEIEKIEISSGDPDVDAAQKEVEAIKAQYEKAIEKLNMTTANSERLSHNELVYARYQYEQQCRITNFYIDEYNMAADSYYNRPAGLDSELVSKLEKKMLDAKEALSKERLKRIEFKNKLIDKLEKRIKLLSSPKFADSYVAEIENLKAELANLKSQNYTKKMGSRSTLESAEPISADTYDKVEEALNNSGLDQTSDVPGSIKDNSTDSVDSSVESLDSKKESEAVDDKEQKSKLEIYQKLNKDVQTLYRNKYLRREGFKRFELTQRDLGAEYKDSKNWNVEELDEAIAELGNIKSFLNSFAKDKDIDVSKIERNVQEALNVKDCNKEKREKIIAFFKKYGLVIVAALAGPVGVLGAVGIRAIVRKIQNKRKSGKELSEKHLEKYVEKLSGEEKEEFQELLDRKDSELSGEDDMTVDKILGSNPTEMLVEGAEFSNNNGKVPGSLSPEVSSSVTFQFSDGKVITLEKNDSEFEEKKASAIALGAKEIGVSEPVMDVDAIPELRVPPMKF